MTTETALLEAIRNFAKDDSVAPIAVLFELIELLDATAYKVKARAQRAPASSEERDKRERPSLGVSDKNDGPVAQVAPAPYVTVRLAATITGLTERAIRRKIEVGKWIEGREYYRSPDGGIFISIKGYQQWIERGTR